MHHDQRAHRAQHVQPITQAHRQHLDESTFHEAMAEQLQRAPWLMLSLALHGLLVLTLLLMPRPTEEPQARAMAMQPPTPVEPIDEPPIDPVPPEDEQIVDDVIVPETDVDVVTEDPVDSEFEHVADALNDSMHDSTEWAKDIGLGGGAAGLTGNRATGRGRLRRGASRSVAIVLERALEWLKRHQDEDGRWDADEFMRHDIEGEACDGAGNPVHDVGMTGLALLAFLGDGSTMRGGPYRDVVRKAVVWLRDQQDPDTGLFGTNSSNEFIYDHAIASYAMVEAYGLSRYKILRDNAQLGIDYLERHRNPYGVWRYQPRDNDNDTSITGWCVMAYKSAQDFGLVVDGSALRQAEAWFEQMTDPTSGRCGYIERGGRSSRKTGDHASAFPREKTESMTAVSLLCRFFLGHEPKSDPLMKKQADLVLASPPEWDPASGTIDHYYWYYGSYALFQMAGRHWKTWSHKLTNAVVKTQRLDGNFTGSWDPIGAWGEDGGRVYSTAILCLTLEAYYRYTLLVR